MDEGASTHIARFAAIVLIVLLAMGLWSCPDGRRSELRDAAAAEIARGSELHVQILNARYDAPTQILELDVMFQGETPLHVFFSGAAFLTQPRRPASIGVIVNDGTLTLDLSRRRRARPASFSSEGGAGMQPTESFRAFCVACRPAGGILVVKYVFRFPIYHGSVWSETCVCERPHGPVPIRLTFGYGTVEPFEYEQTHRREGMRALDREMVDVWQRSVTTAPVTVDFGRD